MALRPLAQTARPALARDHRRGGFRAGFRALGRGLQALRKVAAAPPLPPPPPPSRCAVRTASTAGSQASSMVLSPGSALPRLRMPSQAASRKATIASRSSVSTSFSAWPPRIRAVA